VNRLIKQLLLHPASQSDFINSQRKRKRECIEPPPPKPRKPSSNYEKMVKDDLQRRGWIVHQAGWPDFFCIKPDGSFMLIEAKGPSDKRRPAQKIIRHLFLKHLKKHVYIARTNESGYVKIS
jgi:hypothetical protein